MFRLQVFFVSFLLLFSLTVFAESSSRGRLPDGRAFRTDAQGIQLVDYIAELELGIEELNRKVGGLQYEIEEKDSLINGMRGSGCKAKGLAERDLLSDRMEAYSPTTAEQKVEQALPPCDSSTCPQIERVAEKECPAVKRVVDLSACPELDCSEAKKIAQNSQERYRIEQERSKSTQSQLEKERNALVRQISGLETDLTRRDEQIQRSNNEIISLRENLKQVQSQSKNVLASNLELTKELTSSKEQAALEVAKLKSEVSAASAVEQEKSSLAYNQYSQKRTQQPKASLSTMGVQSASSVKASLKKEYSQLSRMIVSRNNKYRSYKSRNNKVAFRLSALTSSRGYPLSVVKMRMKKASSLRDLTVLQKDVRDIRAKVDSDLALINRMLGVR